MVEVNYRSVVGVQFNQSSLKLFPKFAIGHQKIPWNRNVENQFSARFVRFNRREVIIYATDKIIALNSGEYETASRLQVELYDKIEELKALYDAYEKNII